MAEINLIGITWGHSRGITPLLAASQRFNELHPHIEITWKKRTLQEFADFPIEKLTETYDLLVIDHPWVGCAAATHCVLPLDEHLSPEYLLDQLTNSVGGSHESYNYNGHQWALAIDAATPAASYRADLFDNHHVSVPTTWSQVIDLARQGKVAVPAIPIDLLMNFYMFCLAHGTTPFTDDSEVIDEETGLKALATMKELWSIVDRQMFSCNPIAVAEMMTKSDTYWYCPFAYCYSNYSRTGYAANILNYAGLVTFNGRKLRSTIGGTGLSVSAFSKHKEEAVAFAQMVGSSICQRTLYVEHGGQPGYQQAWTDDHANRLTNNFFITLLPEMESGFIRPRYNGYLHFQDHAGAPLRHFLMHGGNPANVLKEINHLYVQSFRTHKQGS